MTSRTVVERVIGHLRRSRDGAELVRSTNRNPEDVPIESEEESVILDEIAQGRQEITREILTTAASRVADLGIEILDLRFKRINYVEEVQQDLLRFLKQPR